MPAADLEACAIVDGLCEGDSAAHSSDIVSTIPPHWPDHVRDRLWPVHVECWDPLEDRRVLGAWHGAALRSWQLRLAAPKVP